MRRVLFLVVLVAVALPAPASADHPPSAHFTREVVPVLIYGEAEDFAGQAATWALLQAALPQGWPQLPVSYMGPGDCAATQDVERPAQSILVCEDPVPCDRGDVVACAFIPYPDNGVLHGVRIELARMNPTVWCHEGMHALGVTRDHYGSVADSCVYGTLPEPGGYDRWLLAQVYSGQPVAEEPPPRTRTCAKKQRKARKRCHRRSTQKTALPVVVAPPLTMSATMANWKATSPA